jgi:hypothetical protein
MRCSGIAEDQQEEKEESTAKNEEPAETNRGVIALIALLAHFFLKTASGGPAGSDQTGLSTLSTHFLRSNAASAAIKSGSNQSNGQHAQMRNARNFEHLHETKDLAALNGLHPESGTAGIGR